MEENREIAGSEATVEKDKTNPFATLAYKPKRKWIVRIGLFLILAGVAGIFGFLALKKEKMPATKPTSQPPDRLSLQLKVNELIAMEAVARQSQKRVLDLFSQLKEKTGIDTAGWNAFEPTAVQRQSLRRDNIRDPVTAASYLSGLEEMANLKSRIRGLESQLGQPRLVIEGDTHFQIALDFLVKSRSMPEEQARQILKETSLQEPLLPGFKVWNFWLDDGFCTFVTQGEGPVTPEEAAWQKQQKEKEQALSQLNTCRFLIGSYEMLLKRGVLAGRSRKNARLGEVGPEDFPIAIDLRVLRQFRISGPRHGLRKISALALFPDEFREGRDYRVRSGPLGRWAQFVILRTDVFRGRRVVVALE